MWAKLLKENRSLGIKIRELEELIKRNETEMSDIDLDIYEEVNKELNTYVRRLYDKRIKLKYFTDINVSFNVINSDESGKLYRMVKSWGEARYLIYEKEENGSFKIVNNCSDMIINKFLCNLNNIHSILDFIKERTNIHRNYDVISTKKSVCLILKNYKCSSLTKFPKDIVILICKKALSF